MYKRGCAVVQVKGSIDDRIVPNIAIQYGEHPQASIRSFKVRIRNYWSNSYVHFHVGWIQLKELAVYAD